MGLSLWIFALGPDALVNADSEPMKRPRTESIKLDTSSDEDDFCHSRESTLFEESEYDVQIRHRLWKLSDIKAGSSETMQSVFGVRSKLFADPYYRVEKRVLMQVRDYYRRINAAAKVNGIVEDYAGFFLSLATQCSIHFVSTFFLLDRMSFIAFRRGLPNGYPMTAVLLSFPGRLLIPRCAAFLKSLCASAIGFCSRMIGKFNALWHFGQSSQSLTRKNAIRRSARFTKPSASFFSRLLGNTVQYIPSFAESCASAILQNGLSLYLFGLTVGSSRSLGWCMAQTAYKHPLALEVAFLTGIFYVALSKFEKHVERRVLAKVTECQLARQSELEEKVDEGRDDSPPLSSRVFVLERFLNAIAGNRGHAHLAQVHPISLQRPSFNTQTTPVSRQNLWQMPEQMLPSPEIINQVEFEAPERFFRESVAEWLDQVANTGRAVETRSHPTTFTNATLSNELISAGLGPGRSGPGFLVHSARNIIRFMQRFFQHEMPSVVHPKSQTLLRMHWSNIAFTTLCSILSRPALQIVRYTTFQCLLKPLVDPYSVGYGGPTGTTRLQLYKRLFNDLLTGAVQRHFFYSLVMESVYTLLIVESSWFITSRLKHYLDREFSLFVKRSQGVFANSC